MAFTMAAVLDLPAKTTTRYGFEVDLVEARRRWTALGWTVKRLAKEAGVSEVAASKFLNGKPVRQTTMVALLTAMWPGRSIESFLTAPDGREAA